MKTYGLIHTFGSTSIWFIHFAMPQALRWACTRQLSQNWHVFTEGDAPTFEIMKAINLTRILVGEQSGDPATRSQRNSYKAYKAAHRVDLPDFGASPDDVQDIQDDLPPDEPTDSIIW